MDKISPLELKHLLLGEEELALIDVRPPHQYPSKRNGTGSLPPALL